MTEFEQPDKIFVGINDLKTGKAPFKIQTTLGSCVAVCLYCPRLKAGGMLHFMLGSACENDKKKKGFKKAKYADTGILLLISRLEKDYGVEKAEMTAKIFGGANVLPMCNIHIGTENSLTARKILKEQCIPVKASMTGGDKGYRIIFELETGSVQCQILGEQIKVF